MNLVSYSFVDKHRRVWGRLELLNYINPPLILSRPQQETTVSFTHTYAVKPIFLSAHYRHTCATFVILTVLPTTFFIILLLTLAEAHIHMHLKFKNKTCHYLCTYTFVEREQRTSFLFYHSVGVVMVNRLLSVCISHDDTELSFIFGRAGTQSGHTFTFDCWQ